MIRFICLEVADFRGIESAMVNFTPGLNVLYGDNELGKSSLLTALRAVLFLPSGFSEGRDYQTWGSDRTPAVTLTFEIEGTVYRVHKQFASGARGTAILDRLKGNDSYSVVKGAAVDSELRKLIAWGLPEPGRSAPRGLPESYLSSALLGSQEEVEAVLTATIEDDRTESGKQALTEALGALGQDSLVTSILDQLQAATSKVYTPTGQLKRTSDSPLSAKTRDLQLIERRLQSLQEDLAKSEDVEGSRGELKQRAETARQEETKAQMLVDLASNAVAAEKQLGDLQDKEAKLSEARASYTRAEEEHTSLNALAKSAHRAGEIHGLINQGAKRQTDLDQAIANQLEAKQKFDQIKTTRLELEQQSNGAQQQLDNSQQQLATLKGRRQTLVDSSVSLSQSKQRELESNIAAANQRITQAQAVMRVSTEISTKEESLTQLRSRLVEKKTEQAIAEKNLQCAQATEIVADAARFQSAQAGLVAEIQDIEQSISSLSHELNHDQRTVTDAYRQSASGGAVSIPANEELIRSELITIQSLKSTWQSRLDLALAESNNPQAGGRPHHRHNDVHQQRAAIEQDIARWQDDLYEIESRYKRQQGNSGTSNVGSIALFIGSLVVALALIGSWFAEVFPPGIVAGPVALLLGTVGAYFMRPKTRGRSGGVSEVESRISTIENNIYDARARLSALDVQFEGNTQFTDNPESAQVIEAQGWLDNLNNTEANLYEALQQRTGAPPDIAVSPQSEGAQQQIQDLQLQSQQKQSELQALVPVDAASVASSQAFLVEQGYSDDHQQDLVGVAAATEQYTVANRAVELGMQELTHAEDELTFSTRRYEELSSQLGGDAEAIFPQEQQVVQDMTSALALVGDQQSHEVAKLDKDIESQEALVSSAKEKLQESKKQLTDQSATYNDLQSNASNCQARVEQLQLPGSGDVAALEQEFTGIKAALQAIPETTVDFSSLASIQSLRNELAHRVKQSEDTLNQLRGDLAIANEGVTKLTNSNTLSNEQENSQACTTSGDNGSTGALQQHSEAQDIVRQAARDTIQHAIIESNGALNNDLPFTEQLSTLQARQKEKVTAAKNIDRELQMSSGKLDLIGGTVLRDQISREEESKSRIQHEAQEFEADCEAEKYLLDIISETSHQHTAHLGRMLADPVSQKFNELTGNRYGPFTLEPTLSAQSVVADGGQREFDQLSVGTRHQLAVLVRLSLAAYLKASLVLDDQLVQSDPKRLAWFRDTLHQSARDRDHQIIVITCRPADYGVPFEAADVNSAVELKMVISRAGHAGLDNVHPVAAADYPLESKTAGVEAHPVAPIDAPTPHHSQLSPEIFLDEINHDHPNKLLITRIRNECGVDGRIDLGERLSDLLALTEEDLQQLNGFGPVYISEFTALKESYKDYPQTPHTGSLPKADTAAPGQDTPLVLSDALPAAPDLTKMRLLYSGLEHAEKKAIEKIRKNGVSIYPADIVKFNSDQLHKIPGVGAMVVDSLLNIRKKIELECQRIVSGEMDPAAFESSLLAIRDQQDVSLPVLDQILVGDLERFVSSLDEDDRLVFEKRWGIETEGETLEDIGKLLSVTRERVRQLEKKINTDFLASLHLPTHTIWNCLESVTVSQLPNKLPGLGSKIYAENKLLQLIDMLIGENTLISVKAAGIPLTLLDGLFTREGVSCSIEMVKEFVQQFVEDNELENAERIALNPGSVFAYLEKHKVIKQQDGRVYPLALSKADAVATVLVQHPDGMHWREISREVNQQGISKTSLQAERIDPSAFKESDYVFICDTGTYKHTRYLGVNDSDRGEIIRIVEQEMQSFEQPVLHLNQVVQGSDNLNKWDYFSIRYVVKMFGEDSGIYFKGKSQTDSISFSEDFEITSQKQVILTEMLNGRVPLNISDIAKLLRSESKQHASLYVGELIQEGEVIKYDKSHYTVPEVAFASIDRVEYVLEMENILINNHRPVDPSVFAIELNALFGVNYTRGFYDSLATHDGCKKGWVRASKLYSTQKIPYSGLHEAIIKVCAADNSPDENIKLLQEHVTITDEEGKKRISQSLRNI